MTYTRFAFSSSRMNFSVSSSEMVLAISLIFDAISRIISCTRWLSMLLAQECIHKPDEDFNIRQQSDHFCPEKIYKRGSPTLRV
jgi:hypothetical protein